jgi:thioredoxin 1
MHQTLLQPQHAKTPSAALQAAIALLVYVSLGLAGCQKSPDLPKHAPAPAQEVVQRESTPAAEARLPRLLDLGAGKCIPCKKMAPILDELKEEYAGSLEVVFIDVWQDRSAAEKYGIEAIPTQIFFDPSGKELFRHEGFYAKEDILAKWKELGFDLRKKG